MKKNKSPGIDEIPAELLKATGESGEKIFLKLCNRSWKTKKWPDERTKSMIITLPKKGDTRECKNNRMISLISHASKILIYVIAARLENHLNRELPPTQAGFKKGRGTRDQIANMRWLTEKAIEKNRRIFMVSIDYSKAFDCVDHCTLWNMLEKMGFPLHIIHLVKNLYLTHGTAVTTENGMSDFFKLGKGVRQGCILSPLLFNIYGEYIMRQVAQEEQGGFSIGGRNINELRYADDTTLIETAVDLMQRLVNKIKEESEKVGLYRNKDKTKLMAIGDNTQDTVTVDGTSVERVKEFNFLGSFITMEGESKKEIDRRLGIGRSTVGKLQTIWRDKNITRNTKLRIINSMVFSITTYGSETWTLRKRERNRIDAFEMWAYRRLLGISWSDRITNDTVLERVGHGKTLLRDIQRAQLRYFDHVARRDSTSPEKVAMLGYVEGTRSRGRPRHRWTDNIKALVGTSLVECIRLAQDRRGWCEVVRTRGTSSHRG